MLVCIAAPMVVWVALNEYAIWPATIPAMIVERKPDMLSLSAVVSAWALVVAAWRRWNTRKSESAMLAVIAALGAALALKLPARAAWVAGIALLAFVLALNLRRSRFVAIPTAVVVAAIIFIAVPYIKESHSPFAEKVRATFGAEVDELVDGRARDVALNTQWRRLFWKRCVAQTIERAPLFGLGFGLNLTELMKDTPDWPLYIPSQQMNPPNRNPHNAAVTIFARMGFVGIGLWLGLILTTAAVGFRKCWARKSTPPAPFAEREGGDDERLRAILLFGVWLIYLSYALVGDVIENPFGGIPFWVLTGVVGSMSVTKTESQAATVSAGEPQLAKAAS
jgi:O-antigen ligase